MIGETLSHYKIIENLGSGGMGEVFKAEDLRLHRTVALKILYDRKDEKDEESRTARLRFEREAQAASALNHPGVAVVYEIDDVTHKGKNVSFISMEYVPGRTLKDMGRELLTVESLDIVRQIADVLVQAHDRNIVHRDIKPSNLIITDNKRVKILDFGVAKYHFPATEEGETASLYHTDTMTTPGTVIGTFAYMSPEQALGREVDGRSDIFSLGVVLYELLARKLPFMGASALAVVDAVLHTDPLPVGMFNHQINQHVEQITHKMLQKDVSKRYQKMVEVLTDLDDVLRDLTQSADPYATEVGHSTHKHHNTGGLGGGHRSSNGHDTSEFSYLNSRLGKSLAVMKFNNITKNQADDWIGSGIAETVTADLKKIQGITVIGRERVHEVLRRWNVSATEELDDSLATSIGREVGSRWIVCGGYQRIQDMLRVTARFVEVATGEVIKTVKIDGDIKNIFELQDKIVYELSIDLDLGLDSAERRGIEQRETEIVEAYEAQVKASNTMMHGSRESMERALELFDKAVKLDPNYARAWAGYGLAKTLKVQFVGQLDQINVAAEYLQKAIELDPMLPDAYSGLGMAFILMKRTDDAIGALRRALSFAPNDFRVHATLGRAFMIGKGKFKEAAEEYELAMNSNPTAGWAALQLSLCYAYLPNFEKGEVAAQQAVEAQQLFISGQSGLQIIGAFARLGFIYALQGRYEDALAEYYRELVFLQQSDHILKGRCLIEVNQKIISVYVKQNNLDEAQRTWIWLLEIYDALLVTGEVDPTTHYYLACGAALMGEFDMAIEHLSKSIAGMPEFIIARARIETDLDSIKNNPKFQSLINV